MAPGAADAMTARLAERAGFEAVYMTGAGTALTRAGLPDIGLLTMTEMAGNAAAIAAAVAVPVIADADTGYGNALNVRRTVSEFERAGVAAIQIEDQVDPKRCGHLAGKQLVTIHAMTQKIRAACEARLDPDLIIIARCDGLVFSLEDTVRRGHAYVKAGADALFIEELRTLEHCKAIAESFAVPLLYNMSASGHTPFLTAHELQAMGFKIVIYPDFGILATIKALSELLAELQLTGSAKALLDRCASWEDYMALSGLPEMQALEERYGESRKDEPASAIPEPPAS